jgi:hypothetical protein
MINLKCFYLTSIENPEAINDTKRQALPSRLGGYTCEEVANNIKSERYNAQVRAFLSTFNI